MLNVPPSTAPGDLGLTSATRDPNGLAVAQVAGVSGTALAREARARQARVLASLTVSDRSFLGVVLGPGLDLADGASLEEVAASALAAHVAADRDSGALAQGCPIDIAYVRFLAGFSVEDDAGVPQPLLNPRQYDRARRYLELNGGRATIDFRS